MNKRIFLPSKTVEALEYIAKEENINVEEALLKVCKNSRKKFIITIFKAS